jgi:predicted PurR-regulated permease PerM
MPTENRTADDVALTEVEKSEDRRLRRTVLTIVVFLLATAAAVWLAFKISNLLFMVFVSVFVAVAMEPPVYCLAKRGWKRGAATGVVFLAAFLLVTIFVVSMVPLLIDQIGQLIEDIPSYVESVARLMEDWFGLGFTEDQLADQAANAQDWFTSHAGDVHGGVVGIGSSIFGFIFFAVTVGLFSFYMVAELPQLKRTVLSTMPEARQREVLGIWDTAVEKMGGYIYSRLILAVIGATVAVLFLTFLKVPFSVPLGIFVGFLSQFVPVVGTYIAAIVPAIVALSVSGPTAIWVVVFFVLYQQVENFLISPRITKRTMSIHPAISIAAIIIGGAVMGAIGIILALPMAAIIQAVISTSIHRHEVVVSNDPEVASD